MKHSWKDVWKYGVLNETLHVFDPRSSLEKGQLDEWGQMMAEMIRGILVIIVLVILGYLLFKEGKIFKSTAGMIIIVIVGIGTLSWALRKIIRGIAHIRD
ncbi:hypothetical protein [uncultured Sharpea sp.]|uniref:hypothetical protein n=1 Tax=uncultured Sharpea sp. TaxID=1112738 RepID=UPI00258BAF8F|nr:hypothetical protein [uncultured Sharpea sp.]